MTKEELANISMMLITYSGSAKSMAIEAINLAEKSKFKESDEMIENAQKEYLLAGKEHYKALQADNKNEIKMDILFIHAEDQYLNTETILILAEKFINIYKKGNL